ncbi:hypothetical protein MRX96_019503 [Rhipicephalus microplus]
MTAFTTACPSWSVGSRGSTPRRSRVTDVDDAPNRRTAKHRPNNCTHRRVQRACRCCRVMGRPDFSMEQSRRGCGRVVGAGDARRGFRATRRRERGRSGAKALAERP